MPTAARIVALTLVVVLVATGCGHTVDPADVPPTGTVWFGDGFDPSTFAFIGRKTSAAAGDPVAMVGNVGRSVDPGDLVLRVGLGGEVINSPVSGFGKGEVWAFQLRPFRATAVGTWTLELTDIGGNVLATGTIDIETVAPGTIEFGTGGTECSLSGKATTFPTSASFRLVAELNRPLRGGEPTSMSVSGPLGTEEWDDGSPPPPGTHCIYNDIYPGLTPGHYDIEIRAGSEVLAKGSYDITP